MRRHRLTAFLLAALTAVLASPAFGMGLLMPNQEGMGPLAIESHRVNIEVRDNLAVTHIDQVFRNSSGQQLEATFIFPLPDGATVSDFALYINGTRSQGEILEATQARQVYQSIVQRVQDPGLVEYVDGKIFQASIFPVPANGTQRVELEFAQVLELEGELHRLTYPLRTGRTTATTLADFTLSAEITSTMPIRAVYSPTHEIDVVRETEGHAIVGLEQANADLERDFVLYLSTSDEEVGVTLFTFDEDGEGSEGGYFLMLLSPRLEREDEVPAKDVTFVVDTSGSMAGDKLEQAQGTLDYCIGQLGAQDRFNVVRFSTTARALFDDLTEATPENIGRAQSHVAGFRAAGGTAIQQALERALAQGVDPARPHFVIFITDGLPTVGETQSASLVSMVEEHNGGNARLFTFGVGFDVDTQLLDQLAEMNGGTSDYVRPEEDIEVPVSNLYDRIAHPILTDLDIDFGAAEVDDVYPTEIPDLFAGNQIVIAGRYTEPIESVIRMSGQTAGTRRTYQFREDFAVASEDENAQNDFIPQLWATRKIGFLIDQIRLNGEQPELRDEVMHLGLRYGLVTPYTSYLAVDDSEFGDGMRVRGPIPQPDEPLAGWGGAERRERRRSDRAGERDEDESTSFEPAVPMAASGSFSVRASGEESVEAAEETRRMRETEIANRQTAVQQVGRRSLTRSADGVWRERGVEDDSSSRRIQIQYLSTAYFQLLGVGGEVGRLLALGDSVQFRLSDDVIIEIGGEGLEELDSLTERLLSL